MSVVLQPLHWWHSTEHAARKLLRHGGRPPGWWRPHLGGCRGQDQRQLAQASTAAHRSTTLASSSHVDFGAYTPAWRGWLQAALWPGSPSSPGGGHRTDPWGAACRRALGPPLHGPEGQGLLRLFTPKPVDTCLKLILSGELSDRRPIQLMEAMLALLPSVRRTASSSRRCTSLSCPRRWGATCWPTACTLTPWSFPSWLMTSGVA